MVRTHLTLVVSSSCRLCEDAQASLEEIAPGFGLEVRVVDAGSSEGWALLGRYGAGLLPLAVLDGEFFSSGRLPRKKLRRELERRSVPA